ncbi:MAG TPA: metal ABC transporter permease [Candidatus Limnocylindrales bacterium]|nr:metal ABC transporter permease [Candidatus Limnocylindrales bacterium]
MSVQQMLALDFMRNAFIAGGCIALAAGLVGYFVVLRNQVFTADALGHTAFTGSLGGLLAGLNLLIGVFGSVIAVAMAIGTFGGRGRARDVAIGTVFAWILGVGVLFLSLYTTSRSGSAGSVGVSVLFGSILGLQPAQVIVGSVTGIATCAVTVLLARPLLFMSVDPDVAAARGVNTRALTVVFSIVVAVTVAESVQAVGALLIFALMVTPPAIAQNITARPWHGMALSALIALIAVWAGLVLSFYVSLPASFFITALAFGGYLVSALWRLVPRKAVAFALAGLVLSACGLSPTPAGSTSSGKVEVVAAENFWGSIAAQIGGDRTHVTSIIVNPDTDPHAYEATPGDARRIAQAQYVIVNGAGYDPWAGKLISANPMAGRKVLIVADLLGKHEGDNPHFWYSPTYVDQVAERIGIDLGTPDQATQFRVAGLKDYHDTINAIRQRYPGTKVGATESIFSYVADGTGLNCVTPYSYLKAISEGTDPSAADKAEVEKEISTKEIKVFVFNSQNSTPDTQGLVDRATAKGIPVVKITETLSPATATFQDWQTSQLKDLLQALGG